MSKEKQPAPASQEGASYDESTTYKTIKTCGLTIDGYSRAPLMTFWRVLEYKLGFDLGWQPWSFMGIPRCFITHCHLDHILALPAYLARRRMMEMTPPTLWLPEEKAASLKKFIGAVGELEGTESPCEIVGVKPGDEIELSKELVATVYKTFHSTPSVGYVVWERRRKLKPEYVDLPGDKIRDLRASGVDITYEQRIPKVAYLGDSSPEGLDENPDMYEAEVLIAEMTQVAAPGEQPAPLGSHLTIFDYVARKDKFRNKAIIAAHFSVRHSAEEIEQSVETFLPDRLGGRLQLVY